MPEWGLTDMILIVVGVFMVAVVILVMGELSGDAEWQDVAKNISSVIVGIGVFVLIFAGVQEYRGG